MNATPVSDADRRLIFNNFADVHGEEVANKIMELLPHRPIGELATRDDLQALTTSLRGEMAELRGEMAELRGEVRTEIAGLQRWIAGIFATNAVALVTAIVT